MYITTPSVNPVGGSDIHNRLLARNTDNVDSSTGLTDGVVIYIKDY
jgi:hypothetical protein